MSDVSFEHELALIDGSKVFVRIIPEIKGTLFEIDKAEAEEWCEATLQLVEGCAYEYHIPGLLLCELPGLVRRSSIDSYSGRLTPINYVGTLSIDILHPGTSAVRGNLKLEVRSIKMNYRDHYRHMLGEIADKCNELILQSETPLSVMVEPLFSGKPETLYQRFAFLKSLIDSREFSDAVNKIISNPISAWQEHSEAVDIRKIKRFNSNQIKQLCTSSRRSPLDANHTLFNMMSSLPETLISAIKVQTLDTPENRFIKHALHSFLLICRDVQARSAEDSRLRTEAVGLVTKLESFLGSYLFKEQSPPRTIPLNSPVLQRKEGYREVFRVWLMHDLASRITWDGGEDVYEGGRKDVAILYEYWVYFKLLDMVKDVFRIEPDEVSNLLSVSADELSLNIKRGRHSPIAGVFQSETRLLNIEFSYNKSHSGLQGYPNEGSWTRSFRPDYTLSIWPCDSLDIASDRQKAEIEETIVHVHFDAKYRVKDLTNLIGDDVEKNRDKELNPKDDDLIKMHAYRDAIRRTGGAYIIYPGDKMMEMRGFHEIIPGLGAFPLNPGYNESDQDTIKTFMREIARHVEDRASQREKMALKSYQVHKDTPGDSVFAVMPNPMGSNRDLHPDETYVLVGWYKNSQHLEWIVNAGLYNIRIDLLSGSLHLNRELISARYLLLHGPGDSVSGKIMELDLDGPIIRGKQYLYEKGYPAPSQDFYLVFTIANNDVSSQFGSVKWDISKLSNYRGGRMTVAPFVGSIGELVKCRTADE